MHRRWDPQIIALAEGAEFALDPGGDLFPILGRGIADPQQARGWSDMRGKAGRAG